MITSVFIPGNEDIEEALMIRREVFIEEKNVPEEAERDGFDDFALHLMVYSEESPAATGRIWHDGKEFCMGRLAVRESLRGQKIGDLAMRLLLFKGFSSGAQTLKTLVFPELVAFYEKFGFMKSGETDGFAGGTLIEMKVGKDEVKYPSACGGCGHEC